MFVVVSFRKTAPVLAISVLLGCGDKDKDTDASPGCTDCPPMTTDVSPLGETGTTATTLLWPGGSQSWTYDSPRPEWIRLDVTTDTAADITLSLAQGNGEPWAASDGFPASGLASGQVALIGYLPRADRWIVTVDEASDPIDTGATTAAAWPLTLNVKPFGGAVVEAGTTAAPLTVTVADGTTGVSVGTVVDTIGDIDSVLVDVVAGGQPLEVYGWADTPGSDLRPRLLWKYNDLVTGVLDDVSGDTVLSVFEPEPGLWTLEMTDALGGGGSEMWGAYLIRTWNAGDDHPIFGEMPWQSEVEPNEDAGTASSATEFLDVDHDVWQIQGTLSALEDVDVWTTTLTEGQMASAHCWTTTSGSSANLVMDVEVAAAEVTPLGQGSNPTSLGYYVYNVVVDAGPVEFVLRNEGLTAGPGAYYRCRLVASDTLLSVGP